MLEELVRPRQQTVTIVVAMVVILVTRLPIPDADYLTRGAVRLPGLGNCSSLARRDQLQLYNEYDAGDDECRSPDEIDIEPSAAQKR